MVVAVIALLLAILLPALSAANEAGRAAICGTNLHQLLQGATAYSETNDSWMPWYGFPIDRPEGEEWWVTQLARGMEHFEPRVYVCPSDPVPYNVPVYTYQGHVYMNDRTWPSSAQVPYSGRSIVEASHHRADRPATWSVHSRPAPAHRPDRPSIIFAGSGGRTWSTPNSAPFRPEHAAGRSLWMRVTYRGLCSHIIDGGGYNTLPYVARRATEFVHPHKTLVLVEGMQAMQTTEMDVLQAFCAWNAESILLTGKRHRIYPSWLRHFGTTNVGFLDGHVERLDPVSMATISMAWQDQLQPTFRDRWRKGPGKVKAPWER